VAAALTGGARDAVPVAVIETMTFRLNDGADEAAFTAVDKRLQTDFAYQQPGLVRRTTARGTESRSGEWIVVDLWRSAEDADACAARWDTDTLVQELLAFVDASTIDVRRYVDFD
jgi:hypothetical protein